jgi:hypothetical protein
MVNLKQIIESKQEQQENKNTNAEKSIKQKNQT